MQICSFFGVVLLCKTTPELCKFILKLGLLGEFLLNKLQA